MPLLTQASGDSDRGQQGFGWHHCHSDASNEATDWAQARIITHGYVAGGYKDSAPWKNINRTIHSTDTSTDIGDQMTQAANYTDGGNGDQWFYVLGGSNTHSGGSNLTWAWNMTTGSGCNAATCSAAAMGNQGNMSVSHNDLGVGIDYQHAGGHMYAFGGSTNVTDKFQFKTNTWVGTVGNVGSTQTYWASFQGRTTVYCNTSPAINQYMTWANETWATWTATTGTNDGWGKGADSYHEKGYLKQGGNLTTSLGRYNDITGAHVTNITVDDAGEENYQMGNNKFFCLGHYNGAQNNNSYKVEYSNDSVGAGTANMSPKGHAGMSSAAMASSYNFNYPSLGDTRPSY